MVKEVRALKAHEREILSAYASCWNSSVPQHPDFDWVRVAFLPV